MPLLKKEDQLRKDIVMNGALYVTKTTAITAKEGWEGWSMRIFTLGKEGFTPRHSHDWPHINYIVSGKGTLFIDGEEKSVAPGDTAYVKSGELHQFKNAGEEEFSFICIVPAEGDK
ncbi:MAG: cupin domain-containing protein [Spirochaetales bacterium]|nr:cupin domain-containing protein [Spirochaetales bacterium]